MSKKSSVKKETSAKKSSKFFKNSKLVCDICGRALAIDETCACSQCGAAMCCDEKHESVRQ